MNLDLKHKNIKKSRKILLLILLVLLLLPVAGYFTFRSNRVQTRLAGWMAAELSDAFNTRISVEGVDFSFFNQLVLENVLIEDQAQDTLIFVPGLKAQIDTLKLGKRRVHLSNIYLWNPDVRLKVHHDTLNLGFMIDSIQAMPVDTVKQWNISFSNFHLRQGHFAFDKMEKPLEAVKGFDFNHVDIRKLNLSVLGFLPSDSLTTFRVDHFSLQDKSGFTMKNFSFEALLDSSSLRLGAFSLQTAHSNIVLPMFNLFPRKQKEEIAVDADEDGRATFLKKLNQYRIEAEVGESVISLADVAYGIPEIWGMDEPVSLSGNLKGSVDNLKVKRLEVGVGNYTRFFADLDLQGLPDWDKTFIFFKFYDNTFDFRDFASIKLPESSTTRYPNISEEMLAKSRLTYRGNFTGFPSDFVAYGTLDGDYGQLSTDIAFQPAESGTVDFKGRLIAKEFDLGRIVGQRALGTISMRSELAGTRFNKTKFRVNVRGMVDSLYFNNYRLESIFLNGNASERSFDGEIHAEDKNLKLFFSGKADFEPEIPEFNFMASVDKLNLFPLGLEKVDRNSSASFNLDANFIGDNIDNVDGKINFDHINVQHQNRALAIDDLNIITQNRAGKKKIDLQSDVASLLIEGDYRFKDLNKDVRKVIRHYLPSLYLPGKEEPATNRNNFTFRLNVKESEALSQFFVPGLTVTPPVVVDGTFNVLNEVIRWDANLPEIKFKENEVRGLNLRSRILGDLWMVRTGVDEIAFSDGHQLFNLALNTKATNDSLGTSLTWNNYEAVTYSGAFEAMTHFANPDSFRLPYADIQVMPSNVWVADSLWKIGSSRLLLNNDTLSVYNFNIGHNEEHIDVNGRVSQSPEDEITTRFSNLKLSDLNYFFNRDFQVDGTLNGRVGVKDALSSVIISSDLKLDDFSFRNSILGDLLLKSDWNNVDQEVVSSVRLIKKDHERLNIHGSYSPIHKEIDYSAAISELPAETLYPVLRSFSDYIEGTLFGNLRITGRLDDPGFDGDIIIDQGKLGVSYTQTAYTFSDTVRFSNDSILFDELRMYDRENNLARLTGSIKHQFFSHLIYNISMQTDNLLALDTQPHHNDLFYGLAHASGGMKITGVGRTIRMDLSLRSEPNTQMFIPLENPESAKEYDFIRFVSANPSDTDNNVVQNKDEQSGFEVYLDLEATPDARVQIIFDSSIGDVIKGQGRGNLRLVYDRDKNFWVYGDYYVDKGDYLFTLQNVINKKFRIDRGGVISWNGDPYKAQVDLDAVYRLKASLYDLLLDTYEGDYSRRIPVECKINLSDELFNPAVKFAIDFPTAGERTKDEVQQFISTQDDINQQMLSLLVMGQFYTPDYLRNNPSFDSSSSDMVGSTTSEVLSSQLSNWLSQISTDFDIGFNYRPGDEVSNQEVEVALSTQILDDRVTINGNIGNNSSLQSTNSNELIGEVEVYVKLNRSGKLQLKAYNRSNDDLLYDTSLYTQGIGISFREEFNDFEELYLRYQKRALERKRERARKRARKAEQRENLNQD